MASSSTSFGCEYPECNRNYDSYKNLLRHYRENRQHKPESLESKRKPSAKELVDALLPKNMSEVTQVQQE